MKAPRVSMASLCVFIGIVAVNLAWPRFLIVGNKGSLLGFGDGDYAVLDLGVLGMLDICVLAFYGLRRGPFRIGFVIGGVFAVLAFACLCWLAPRVFAWDFILARGIMPVDEWLMRHLPSVIPSYSPRKTPFPIAVAAIFFIAYSAIIATPMVAFASVCGLATRFIVRRARASPLPSLETKQGTVPRREA